MTLERPQSGTNSMWIDNCVPQSLAVMSAVEVGTCPHYDDQLDSIDCCNGSAWPERSSLVAASCSEAEAFCCVTFK